MRKENEMKELNGLKKYSLAAGDLSQCKKVEAMVYVE